MENVIAISSSAFAAMNIVSQEFSLPSSLIYYVKNNPLSPKGYIKVIKSCKYFYSKKHFFVPFYDFVTCKYRRGISKANIFNKKRTSFCFEDVSFNLWLTGQLYIQYEENELSSNFFLKIQRCDVRHLLIYDATLQLDDFKLLTQKTTYIALDCTIVKYKNDTVVSIDVILSSVIAGLKIFDYVFPKKFPDIFSPQAIKNVVEIVCFSELDYFGLKRVHRSFEIKPFFDLIKDRPEIQYNLDFRGPLPKNKRKQLRSYVRNFIEIGITEISPPLILYSSQKRRERKMLCDLIDSCDNFNKILEFFDSFEEDVFL